jgi:hypothetical protein
LKSGSLNLLERSGPVQACNGIALLFSCVCDGFSTLFYDIRIAQFIDSMSRHMFLGAFAKLRNVCPSACNNLAPTERIFMKFDI